MNFFTVLPLWARLTAYALLAAAIFTTGWVKGTGWEQHKQSKKDLKVERLVQKVYVERVVISEKAAEQIIKVVEKVRTVTKETIKEVPTYVSANDCPMSPGFRVLHDAAAAGQLPDPARIADAAAVPAPALAHTVTENYGACLENAARLTGLQNWVKDQQAVKVK